MLYLYVFKIACKGFLNLLLPVNSKVPYEVKIWDTFAFKSLDRLKVNSHREKEKAKAKKIKEQAEKIREKAAMIKGHFRFRIRFHLV